MKQHLKHISKIKWFTLVVFVLVFAGIGADLIFFGHAATNPVGDLNGDGTVNIFDLSIFLGHWQQTSTGLPEDFNNDGIVNIFDLSILLGHWGQTATTVPTATLS